MTSSHGNIFRVTGPLSGEFTGHRWIPRTKANDPELWCFIIILNKGSHKVSKLHFHINDDKIEIWKHCMTRDAKLFSPKINDIKNYAILSKKKFGILVMLVLTYVIELWGTTSFDCMKLLAKIHLNSLWKMTNASLISICKILLITTSW